jgi:DNA-binding NarL/FixJ family response regulator
MVSGGQAAHTAPPCDLCARLRDGHNMPKRGQAPSGGDHGLRIALVDDDEETRLAVRQMVQAQRESWVLEVYHPSCPNALEGDHGPGGPADIVLIGLPNREASRLPCMRRLKAVAPDLPVLIISGQRDPAAIVQYCMAGAGGWLTKPLVLAELARAVRAAAQGSPVLCRQAAEALLDFLHQVGKSVSFHGLPQRQREILVCLGENFSNKEIAQRLGVSHETVHVQVGRLLRKLGAHTRKQLVKQLLGREGEE